MKEFYEEIIAKFKRRENKESEELTRIKHALYEVKRARSNFNMVVGADNVELAILELNAAEKRYRNLIKELKSNSNLRFGEEDTGFDIKATVD
ncbi:MAG: hypothetical protein IKZ35_03025 [Clostridia bacterium]|nr:hypothetical protein [Clostridia bacterium]